MDSETISEIPPNLTVTFLPRDIAKKRYRDRFSFIEENDFYPYFNVSSDIPITVRCEEAICIKNVKASGIF